MNIFRVLASGKQTFREEFISAFMAYLLSPKMDHGLGSKIFSSLLEQIGHSLGASELIDLSEQLGDKLRSNLFSDEDASV
ncbi:MAG: PD-(D/E)XK nuclease family protein, partial [Chloroflexota bacterium]